MALAKVEIRNERFFTQVLDTDSIVIQGVHATDVSLNIDVGQIASLGQQGNDLVIQTVTGEVIVLHGFYAPNQDGKPNRLFVSDDGAIAQVDTYNTYDVNYFQAPAGTESLIFTAADHGMPVGLLAAAGAGVLAGGAALAFAGGDDEVAAPNISSVRQNADGTITLSGSGQPGATMTVRFPDDSTVTVTAAADGAFGPVTSDAPQTTGDIRVIQSGTGPGTQQSTRETFIDELAPLSPVDISVTSNADGTITITGSGEAGSTVDLILPSGEALSDVPVGDDGTFGPITSTQNQPNGAIVATQVDAAGNTSTATTITFEDVTPPAQPLISQVTANDDGTLTIIGQGEPDAIVTIQLPSGETLDNVEVGVDGSFGPVTSEENQPSGTITAVQTDAEGNASPAATQSYVDTTPPVGPEIVTITPDVDGTVTILGTGEPGATVEILLPSGEILANIAVDDNGNFGPATSTENQPSGTVTLIQVDEAGNISGPTSVVYADAIPPAAPNVDVISANPDGTVTISGRGEPGATIELTLPSGETIRDVAVAPDGTFGPVTSVENQPTGDVIAVQTDDANNVSEPGAQTYRDSTPPEAPTFDSVIADDDGTLSVTGRGEPAALVTVTFPSGEIVANVEVGENGIFGPVISTENQPSGDVTATQVDAEGNVSPAATQSYVDTTPPVGPEIVTITPDVNGTVTILGTGEPGATVEILLPSGETLANIAVDENGNFGPAISTENQPSGTVTLIQVDEAGNISGPTSVVYADAIPPAAPNVDVVSANPDGTVTISGRGEPGATIELTLPSGEAIRDVAVAPDGTFGPVTSIENQPTGDVIAVQTDDANNASAPGAQTYRDFTSPEAPTFDSVIADDDGTLSVTGRGEPGALVTVTFPSGEIVANVEVGVNGIFGPVISTENQPSGDVTATQVDAEGNVSPAGSNAYQDTVAPAAPVVDGVTPNTNGTLTLSGTAEPDATVDITFPSGETVTDIPVAQNGTWGPVTSVDVQPSGTVSASQTDAEGNTSPPAASQYTDGVPPLAPDVGTVTANPDGTLTISGTGEPGATVDITLPSGETINDIPVATNGTFGPVTSTENQPSGNIVAVQTDAAGNASAPSTDSYTDNIPPAAPTIGSVTPETNGSLTISGTGEPGATVDITLPSGEIIANVPVATDGSFGPVTSGENQPSGDVTATQTDAEGNTSPSSGDPFVDTTPPAAPVIGSVTANTNGTISILGTGEPGATVQVTMPSGEVISGVAVAIDGSFGPVESTQAQPNGNISATQTDAANNTSPAVTQPYTDATAPSAPTIDTVSQNVDGTIDISGTGEPGATVNLSLPSGEVITGIAVANNGTYGPVTSTNPQDSGNITATQTDPAGNTSPQATQAFVEGIAPDAPTINPTDGTVITGTGEVGATINLDIDGDCVADVTTVVDGTGNWTYTPSTPIGDDVTICATQTDVAGNESARSDLVVANDPDGDLISNSSDLDDDGDGIADIDELTPQSSITVTPSTSAAGEPVTSPTTGYVVNDTSSGNIISFTATAPVEQNGNDSGTPADTTGTITRLAVDLDSVPTENLNTIEMRYSVGTFDDGIIFEINGVTVLDFFQPDYLVPAIGNKYGNGDGDWRSWTGEGNPELVVDLVSGSIQMLVDTAAGGREDILLDIQTADVRGDGSAPFPNPVPTIDIEDGLMIGAGYRNSGAVSGITEQDVTFEAVYDQADVQDVDGDGTLNSLDTDSDGDGVLDSVEGVGDADGDGVANYRDTDPNNFTAPTGSAFSGNSLVFDSGGSINIDLTGVDTDTIPNVERVNMTGDQDNLLTITAADLLDLSIRTDELIVLGDAGDTVDANGGFTDTGTTRTINNEVYDIYVSGGSTLIVHEDVTVLI